MTRGRKLLVGSDTWQQMWLLTGHLQPLDFRWRFVAAGGGPTRTPARCLTARGGSVGDKNLQSKVFGLPNTMAALVLRKNGRKFKGGSSFLLRTHLENSNFPLILSLKLNSGFGTLL
jgi:hypothetical protein